MKKAIIATLLIACSSLQSMAQTTLQGLLQSVEQNNPQLIVASKSLLSTSASLKMGRNPMDPEVEYSHVFGTENSNEVTLKQSFDFPTVYRQRNNVAKYGTQKAEAEFMATRQTIFSEVTTLYVNVIALNNELVVLKNRLENAQRIKKFFDRKLEAGETTVLEKNKVSALYINAHSQLSMTEMELQNVLNQIAQMNGGQKVSINSTVYPDFGSIENALNVDEIIRHSHAIQAISLDSMMAKSQLKLSKQEWIPSLSVGYKAVFTKGNYNNGLVAGISIPLWQKRGNVKFSKMNKELSLANYNEMYTSQRTELENLVRSMMSYTEILSEYSQYMKESRNEELLLKALESGTITMTDYLVELSLFYDTVDMANNAQKSLNQTKAQMTKYLNK